MTLDVIQPILADALELPLQQRRQFVRQRCAGDADLEREVLELLAADEEDLSLVDRPLVDRAPPRDAARNEPETPPHSETIGPYRILGEIGSGGMGIVYEAEQRDPVHRRVALKLIKPGMDSREVTRRFEMERRLLFSLEHPDIARAYDAGTSQSGHPYFVMELVDGSPIDRYCDLHQLDLEQRLRLFSRACRAVQYAHLRGVIHRDFKPSNVLISDGEQGPAPKIIDFGIAKALAAGPGSTSLTQHAQPIGTPEAMSPEQAEGRPVDARTDVYSAGALLYRLISGTGPFSEDPSRSSDWPSLQRLIVEQTPVAPSVSSRVRGIAPAGVSPRRLESARELDWIVLRALAKEADHRYQSMADFADDVERFLRHDAVSAGPERWSYRARKLVRRNRVAVATGALATTVLVGGSLVLAVQAVRLRTALEVAQTERSQAEQVTSLMSEILAGGDPLREGRKDVTALELLDRGEPRIREELADQPAARAELLRVIAQVRRSLGDDSRAAEIYQEVAELEGELGNQEAVARALTGLAVVRESQTRFEDSELAAREALAAACASDEPERIVAAMQILGWALARQGFFDEGERFLNEAIELAQNRAPIDRHVTRDIRRTRATVWNRLGRADEALAELEALLEAEERQPSTPTYAISLHSAIGAMLIDLGRSESALPHLERVLEQETDLLGSAHPQTLVSRSNIALAAGNVGQLERARRMNLESLDILEQTTPGPHGEKALLLNNLGLNQHGLGDLDAAETSFREALRIQRAVVGDDHPNLAFHLSNLARVLQETGRSSQAERHYRHALALRTKHLPADHPTRADTEVWLGALLLESGRPREALPHLELGVSIREAKMAPDGWQVAEARSWLGTGLIAVGRVDEGLPLVVDAYPVIRAQRGDHWWRTPAALQRVANAYGAAGDEERARETRALLVQRHPDRSTRGGSHGPR